MRAPGGSDGPLPAYLLDKKELSKTKTIPERRAARPAAPSLSTAARQIEQNALLPVAEFLLLVYYNHKTHLRAALNQRWSQLTPRRGTKS